MKMLRPDARWRFCARGLIVALSASVSAAPWSDADMAAAEQLVREYVDRDSKAERFSANDWFARVHAWDDAPAADGFALICGATVGEARRAPDAGSVLVTVTYERIGWLESGEDGGTLVSDVAREVVDFDVVRDGGTLLIAAPSFEPRVRLDALPEGALSDRQLAIARELAARFASATDGGDR